MLGIYSVKYQQNVDNFRCIWGQMSNFACYLSLILEKAKGYYAFSTSIAMFSYLGILINLS